MRQPLTQPTDTQKFGRRTRIMLKIGNTYEKCSQEQHSSLGLTLLTVYLSQK